MGKRLSKIYTRTGDDGSTGLGDGSRTAKDDPRVEAFGTVDELNACIGLIRAEAAAAEVDPLLERIQHELFDLGGQLCMPGTVLVRDEHVGGLERDLDELNSALPALEEFVLPGGGRAASCCHLARTVCRRAERRLLTLHAEEAVDGAARRYLNRLSDLLFVIARGLARSEGGEVLWRGSSGP